MKAIIVEQFGGPEVLVLVDQQEVVAGPGQVVIAVEAAGVGFVDGLARLGLYPGLGEPGFTPGVEVAGTVASVGAGGDPLLIGRRVFAIVGVGGYAEEVAVSEAQIIPLTDQVSCAQAVGLGVNALVACLGVERTRISSGDRVLVRGAGGGIGVLAVQAASAAGAIVTAVTSTDGRAERLKEYGADLVFNRTSGDELKGDFDVIFDPVGGDDVALYLSKLAANGRYLMCGVAGGLPPPDFGATLLAEFKKSLTFSTFSLDSAEPETLGATMMQIFRKHGNKGLVPVVEAYFPLANAMEAHRLLEQGSVFGKLILMTD